MALNALEKAYKAAAFQVLPTGAYARAGLVEAEQEVLAQEMARLDGDAAALLDGMAPPIVNGELVIPPWALPEWEGRFALKAGGTYEERCQAVLEAVRKELGIKPVDVLDYLEGLLGFRPELTEYRLFRCDDPASWCDRDPLFMHQEGVYYAPVTIARALVQPLGIARSVIDLGIKEHHASGIGVDVRFFPFYCDDPWSWCNRDLLGEPFIVVPAAPEAFFTVDISSGAGPLVVNPSNRSTGQAESYEWYLDGDGSGEPDFTGREPGPITYLSEGDYTLTLKATGPGGSDTWSIPIQVTGTAPPVAGFEAEPTSGPAPLEVAFTNQSSGPIDTHSWDFNGDEIEDSDSPNPDPFTYTDPGDYNCKLIVEGPGGVDDHVVPIHVTDPWPGDYDSFHDFKDMAVSDAAAWKGLILHSDEAGTLLDLSPYVGGVLKITDGSGNYLQGTITVAGSGPTLGSNLVSNGGLESGDDWVAYGGGSGGRVLDAGEAREGSYYYSWEPDTWSGVMPYSYQTVVAKTVYRIAFWSRMLASTCRHRPNDGPGYQIYYGLPDLDMTNNSSWVEWIKYRHAHGSGEVRMEWASRSWAGVHLHADHYRFQEVTEPPPEGVKVIAWDESGTFIWDDLTEDVYRVQITQA